MVVRPAGRRQAPPAAKTPASRVLALDGLRGIVIVLVVLGHATGSLWPFETAYELPLIGGLFGGGAVVIFFVVGAFIVSRNILRERERGTHDPIRFYLRRLVRLGGQLVLLALALVLIWRFDPNDAEWSGVDLANNIVHLLTYTLNLFSGDTFRVRSEVGAMWYLSVQQQCYLLLPLVLLLGRWRRSLAALLLGVCVVVYLNRQAVLAEDGWVHASIGTATRADGLIIGVVAALLLPWLGRVNWWPTLIWVSGWTLLGLQAWLPELPDFAFLGWWSIAYTLAATVIVVAVWCTDRRTLTIRFLSLAPLVWLGRNSLSIYIWHLAVILVVTRNTADWDWPARTLLAVVILGALVVVMDVVVERPTRRLLATHRLFRVQTSQGPGGPRPEPAPDGGARV